MNNNIGNNLNPNPLGFNPQGHKACSADEQCEIKETCEEITEDKDPLKYVPGDSYGRAMVNKAQQNHNQQLDSANIDDDIYTFELISGFAKDLAKDFIKKGVEPQKAYEIAASAAASLLHTEQ